MSVGPKANLPSALPLHVVRDVYISHVYGAFMY